LTDRRLGIANFILLLGSGTCAPTPSRINSLVRLAAISEMSETFLKSPDQASKLMKQEMDKPFILGIGDNEVQASLRNFVDHDNSLLQGVKELTNALKGNAGSLIQKYRVPGEDAADMMWTALSDLYLSDFFDRMRERAQKEVTSFVETSPRGVTSLLCENVGKNKLTREKINNLMKRVIKTGMDSVFHQVAPLFEKGLDPDELKEAVSKAIHANPYFNQEGKDFVAALAETVEAYFGIIAEQIGEEKIAANIDHVSDNIADALVALSLGKGHRLNTEEIMTGDRAQNVSDGFGMMALDLGLDTDSGISDLYAIPLTNAFDFGKMFFTSYRNKLVDLIRARDKKMVTNIEPEVEGGTTVLDMAEEFENLWRNSGEASGTISQAESADWIKELLDAFMVEIEKQENKVPPWSTPDEQGRRSKISPNIVKFVEYLYNAIMEHIDPESTREDAPTQKELIHAFPKTQIEEGIEKTLMDKGGKPALRSPQAMRKAFRTIRRLWQDFVNEFSDVVYPGASEELGQGSLGFKDNPRLSSLVSVNSLSRLASACVIGMQESKEKYAGTGVGRLRIRRVASDILNNGTK